MRPPGSKLITYKNECPERITVAIYYGSPSKTPPEIDRSPSWNLEAGRTRDEIFGTVDSTTDMVVEVSEPFEQKRGWPRTELPTELKKPEGVEGDAIMQIYSDHMVLRNPTRWERFEHYGGPSYVLLAFFCCGLPIFGFPFAMWQSRRTRRTQAQSSS